MKSFLDSIWSRLQEVFDPNFLGAELGDLVINLLVAALTFFTFYLGWLFVRLLLKTFMRPSDLDETSKEFIRTVLKYGILLVGLVNALSVMGIDTAGLLASLGIMGITIGFAARDAFSNLISGILIYIDRPFVIGDLV